MCVCVCVCVWRGEREGGQGAGAYEAPQTSLLFMSRFTKTLSTILYGRTSIARTPMSRSPWLMVLSPYEILR